MHNSEIELINNIQLSLQQLYDINTLNTNGNNEIKNKELNYINLIIRAVDKDLSMIKSRYRRLCSDDIHLENCFNLD